MTAMSKGDASLLASAVGDGETRRLTLYTRVLAGSILWCVAFSWRLWLDRSSYPLVPFAGLVPAFSTPWDGIALAAWCGVVAGVMWRPASNLLVGVALAAMAMFFLQDQSRLWPSYYQFFLLLFLRSGFRQTAGDDTDEASRVLMGMRFVVAATYFWGGIQKLTPHFFYQEFPWFIEPLTNRLPFELPGVPQLGVVAAILEAGIGVGLLTRRFRRAALGEALLMHALIVFCIGPLRGHWNDAAWAWSQAAAVQVLILFWKAPPFSVRTMVAGPPTAVMRPALVFLLAGVLPLLNNVNRWDSALSFNVYSGNVSQAQIVLAPKAVAALPPSLVRHIVAHDLGTALDLNAWSRSEFQANQYPENRIFQAVFRRVCEMVPPGTATLYVIEKATWFTPRRSYRYPFPADAHVTPPDGEADAAVRPR